MLGDSSGVAARRARGAAESGEALSRLLLRRLCRVVVPFAADDEIRQLLTDIEERVATFDPYRRKVIPRLIGFAGMFSKWFAGWETSSLPSLRTVHQAVRRLILSTWYGDPVRAKQNGYRGALSARAVAVPWEGPKPPAFSSRGFPTLPVTPGRTIADASTLTCQDLVIGSGAGGSVAAAILAESGRDVIVLESGKWWPRETWDDTEGTMMPRLYAELANRATDDQSIPIFQGEGVGGGTVVNWMMTLRTPDWVLDEWADEHGMEDMRPADMAPVFDEVERVIHAHRVADDAHNPQNRLILDAAAALGWSARPALNNARDCVRAGTCGFGCTWGAKQDALVTWLPRAAGAGARIYSETRAERVGGSGAGRRVDATTPTGRVTIACDRVILAAGAVGTPAILQQSGFGGPAVGRWLRLHPTTAVSGTYDREMDGSTGIPQSAVLEEFLAANDGYGHWIECPPVHPGLASIAIPGYGASHRSGMMAFPHRGVLIALTRDGADRTRSSGRVRVTRSGRTRIDYRVAPADEVSVRAAIITAIRIHQANGASEIQTVHAGDHIWPADVDARRVAALSLAPNRIGLFSAHVNGTARIGRDPDTSVCTPDGQVRAVPGLFVLDGSVLPTAPGVNPQETIMAVATVLARRMI